MGETLGQTVKLTGVSCQGGQETAILHFWITCGDFGKKATFRPSGRLLWTLNLEIEKVASGPHLRLFLHKYLFQ